MGYFPCHQEIPLSHLAEYSSIKQNIAKLSMLGVLEIETHVKQEEGREKVF